MNEPQGKSKSKRKAAASGQEVEQQQPTETESTPMSETQETPAAAAEKKAATVYTPVTMADGRVVQFAGARKVQKSVDVNEETGAVSVRFDFRSGSTKSISSSEISEGVKLRALGHGLSQKIGDEWSGTTEIEDMELECDAMIARLKSGDWGVAREAGDSMKGASVVIRALCEVSGKAADVVKKYLDDILEAAKAKGEKLSRQELYASFRNPTTETGKVIKRLEEEKISKASKVDAASIIGGLMAG